MKNGKVHLHKVSIDFDLLDPGNVVYHPNYLVLCDRARTQALTDAGYPVDEMWKDGFGLALVETHTQYKSPARMGQSLAISTKLLESQRVSLVVEQKLFLAKGMVEEGFLEVEEGSQIEKVLFIAKIKLVCVSLEQLKAASLPNRLEKALELTSSRAS